MENPLRRSWLYKILANRDGRYGLMHCLVLGVIKRLFSIWCGNESFDQGPYIPDASEASPAKDATATSDTQVSSDSNSKKAEQEKDYMS